MRFWAVYGWRGEQGSSNNLLRGGELQIPPRSLRLRSERVLLHEKERERERPQFSVSVEEETKKRGERERESYAENEVARSSGSEEGIETSLLISDSPRIFLFYIPLLFSLSKRWDLIIHLVLNFFFSHRFVGFWACFDQCRFKKRIYVA